jgi:hypothetical protein
MTKTVRELWTDLDTDRRCALDRKREHAMYTMPELLPYEGRATHAPLDVPYSSLPAEGINALSSRTTSVVFPLNGQSVFEIMTPRQLVPEGEDTTEIDASFARFEELVMDRLAPTNLRAAVNLVYKHLLVVGDCLIYMDDDLSYRVFRADQYVVRRKHEGDWMELIIQEAINPEWYPEILEKARSAPQTVMFQTGTAEKWEPLYTRVTKDPRTGRVKEEQWFRDVLVGEKEYEVSPWAPVRWGSLAGEPYGISLVENMFGDIRALDALSKALLDGAMLNAEYRWGVNPAGLTEMQDMLDSQNGDFVPATASDVFPLQFQNHSQVQATQAAVIHREQMVGRRFLMNSAVQPKGERVTARQVSLLAQELESMLGGVLSHAARELQEPILRRVIYVMGQRNEIPSDISKEIEKSGGFAKLRVRAGLEILNREAEREKLDMAIERMRNLPPEALEAFVWTEIARDWWQSMGLETAGRVKTQDQLEQERAQRQQQEMAAQAAQAGVQAGLQNQGATE